MNVSMSYALHTLWRNRTRTLVSLLGLGIGGMIALLTMAWMRGESKMIASSTALSGQGYLQVVNSDWHETRDNRLRITHYQPLVEKLRARPEVTVVAPQVELESLLGMGTKVQGVSLLGVEPEPETKIRRLIRGLDQGRYLQEGDDNAVVLGQELASRLDVELGDELVVTAVKPNGDMNSALLVVVGLIRSGSKSMDATIAHVPLDKAIELSGRQGVNRLSLLVSDPLRLEQIREPLRQVVKSTFAEHSSDPAPDVLTWTEVNPALVAGEQSDKAFSDMMVFVVSLLIILGITSAQLTGVLQRGREFSVLLALGMKRPTLWRLVFTEAGLLGLGGGLLSLALGAWPLWYLSQVGVDWSQMVGEEGMAMGGVLMDPIMKADAGLWVLVFAFSLSLFASMLGAVYPVIWSLKLDPASTLRSRN